MGLVAGVTVASFEAVGSILVVAMLIVPAATAQLLTDRLRWMLLWAALVAAISAVVGYAADAYLNTNMAGMMAVVAGLQFLMAVLLSPRHGILARAVRNARLSLRIIAEDLLGYLYRQEEAAAGAVEVRPRQGGRLGWLVLPWLRWTQKVRSVGAGRFELTPAGRKEAQQIVRAHRLWEAYLEEKLALPPDHLHEPAARMEHYLGPTLQGELAAQLGRPDLDPHGKAIPPQSE
jgi:manganese/zinc/iron transport system permease protein